MKKKREDKQVKLLLFLHRKGSAFLNEARSPAR
jgi:hypothetical protein